MGKISKTELRTAELMSQLKGEGYEERASKVQNLAERGRELNRSMQQNLAGARKTTSRKAPWDQDSDSDDGRSDTAYLTPDGREVVQKEYKLINGHWGLITYRKQLHEVDPYLLLKLREKREKEVAKLEAKDKRKGKKVERDGIPRISTPLAQLTGMKAPRPTTQRTDAAGSSGQQREKRAGNSGVSRELKERVRKEQRGETSAPPTSHDAEFEREASRWRHVSKGKSPVSPSPSSSSSSSSSSASPYSFKARAKQSGFCQPQEHDSGHDADSDITDPRVPVRRTKKKTTSTRSGESQCENDGEEYLDIWQKIADEDDGETTYAQR